jgi:predicted nucleic acid-binding protein
LLVLRFVLDTHVLDAMIADPTLLDAVNGAVAEGRIEVHVTHVQIDEAMATPDEKADKRSALAQTLADSAAQRSPTYGFIIGMSRLDEATITGDDFAATYSAEVAAFPSQGNDAVLISTAWKIGAKFVTEDRGARATAGRMGMPCCCTIAEFRAAATGH